ncbi:Aldolase-type TIM barrel [Penicillium alfredii]|uniref:Aldolase-type TIM barrel n=1 Tax=Penicillium alfredii TaxID=1506179 RepID=A0A9W9FK44_9EURO|nr:Aldolase-type TIM barrel [Penicillium alfredii]KAJ5101569.1 Aldolase-type TIM barrel [Penicillium alfredii]
MKFTAGMSSLQEGISIDWMSNVERLRIEKDSVDLLLNKVQRHRGDTLNSATVSARVTSPLEGLIGVKLVHWAGQTDHGPHYHLNTSTGHITIQHDKPTNQLNYDSGSLKLNINTTPNDLNFTFTCPNNKKLTGHSWRSIGYVADLRTTQYRPEDGLCAERQGYILAALDLGVREKIYGLGHRRQSHVDSPAR